MSKLLKFAIIITILLNLFIIGTFVSLYKFSTANPISSLCGLIEITYTDKEYTVIQKKPWRVIVAKPDADDKNAQNLLDKYMKERGYEPSDRNGSIITYTNSDTKDSERIEFRVNKYYSVWEWI